MGKFIKSLVAALAIFGLPVIAHAGPADGAEAVISETLKQVEQQTDQELIADSILENVNTDAVATIVLGAHKSKLSETDQARFSDAIGAYLKRQIVSNADEIAQADVSVVRTDTRGARNAIVTTRVAGDEAPYTLRWRLAKIFDGWSVVDIEFAGVWLAIEQRAQVDAILAQPGADIDDVIARFG